MRRFAGAIGHALGRKSFGETRTAAALGTVGCFFMSITAPAQAQNPSYDYAAVVQEICRQYAAAQTALPYDTMYAQCMFARGIRVPGFTPSPDSPGYQGELPGAATHNGGY
jgi:hypothetical protein